MTALAKAAGIGRATGEKAKKVISALKLRCLPPTPALSPQADAAAMLDAPVATSSSRGGSVPAADRTAAYGLPCGSAMPIGLCFDLMANRQRAPTDLPTVDLIERLTALEERDREKDAEIAALQHAVETLLRASTATIVRQAKVEAEGLLSLKEASFDTGFSTSAIRKWIVQRKVRCVPVGGRVYVTKASLAEFMTGARHQGQRAQGLWRQDA
jgi:hypothetical protein